MTNLADELERLVWEAHRKPEEGSKALAQWAFVRLPTLLSALRREETDARGYLPIVLCPTDGVDRALLLPDGREVVGAYHAGGLGQKSGWRTSSPIQIERPVYEAPLLGGFIAEPNQPFRLPDYKRTQTGTRTDTMWVVGSLPEGVYPTHFRPNDTVHGTPKGTDHE